MKKVKKTIALLNCIAIVLNSTSPVWAVIKEEKDNTSNIEILNSGNLNDKNKNSTITWTSSDSIEVGSIFDKMNGVKALDKDGKDITQLVSVEGEVNTEKTGTYTLKYTVTSDKGEVINASRNITVIENKSQETINNEIEDTENNKGPKITGSDIIRTYLGEEFDPKFGVSAIDENGKDITELITIEGEVKTNELGAYELKYSVVDELGKTATFNRKVQVINKNIFNAYIEKINEETNEIVKELGFSIYLDNKTSKFVVENQSTDKLNPSIKDEIAFKIRVLDKDNNEKLAIDLLGDDTGDSEKLNALKELEYSYGDFIEIHPRNVKEGFNIEGPILGDIDIEKEDYFDGVDNIDYIQNVRFKIVEEGIESIYNNAPEITGLEVMENLLTDRNKQLEGIKVTDDHDGDIPNDNIQISEEKDDKNNIIGLRYTVSDSWGRNISQVRLLKPDEVKLYSSTEDEEKNDTVLSQNDIEVHGVNYPDGDTLRFWLRFNQDTKKIDVKEADGRLFDNKVKDKYFELIIYDKYGNVKEKLTINGSDRSDTDKLFNFKGNFEYGDQIHLYHKYSDTKLKIRGSIQGLENNDHNNGIESDNLITNRFELTQTGLKYLVNKRPEITWSNENLTITRGQRVNLLDDITISDDIDGELDRNRATVTDYNPNQLGEQTVTYTVRDSWGLETTKQRTISIVSDTNLANTSIDIMKVDRNQNDEIQNGGSPENNETQNGGSQEIANLESESQEETPESGGQNNGTPSDEGQKAFSIKFDDFEKKILVVDRSEHKLNEAKSDEVAFRIRIFSKAGITKKDISLNGNEDGLNSKLDELNNFKYTDGDTIELWSSEPKKGLKIVGNIVKDDEIKEDSYKDGIDDINFMNNVRFELKVNTLYAKYNNAPSIEFNDDLTIKRGEEFDPIKFIKAVKDDHDNINNKLVRASYKKDEIHKVGKHEIVYKVSDKWGRSYSETKTIQVLPKNKLEETKIKLMKEKEDGTKEPILTLYFDDVENKIVRDIVTDATIQGEPNTDVFKIRVFDSLNELKGESTIKANEGLNSSSLSEVTQLTLEPNDTISVSAYESDMVSIDGEVVSNHKNSEVNKKYENGFENNDKMNNTRFRLTSDGLKELYNEAPEFHGVEDTSILKGETFNNLDGVSVTDDHDAVIPDSKIKVTGNINNQELGPQTLTYEVSDSWGRTTQKTRTVTVKSKAANNEIELKNSLDETAFKIGFDFVKNKFTVSNQSSSPIDSSNEGHVFFIFIADRNDQYVDSVLLQGTDTGNSDKLNKLNNITVRTGYKFFVWSKEHSKLNISGNITTGNEITKADYRDGINHDDIMNNSIFEVTEDGLKVIYNKAPVINLRRTTPIFTLYKGDDYKTDLLAGVKVTDDHDGNFSEEEIREKMKITLKKVTKESSLGNEFDLSKESDLSKISLGKYVATYTIKDSWGRSSSVSQEVEILTSIYRNEINFGGHRNGQDTRVDIKLGFDSTDGNDIKFKIMEVSKDLNQWYDIYVLDKDDKVKGQVNLRHDDTGDKIKNKLEKLLDVDIKYGDYIWLNTEKKFRYSIDGPVRNGREDYFDGVDFGDDLSRTKFHITEEGLSVTYTPLKVEENESIIEYVGTRGRIPFRIKFDHETRRITYMPSDGFYDYFDPESIVFKVIWHKKNQNTRQFTKEEFEYKGIEEEIGGKLREFVGNTFNDGDYITFWTKTPSKVRVYGKLANDKNYSDGVPSEDILTNTRFTLRSDNGDNKHLDPVYNEGPKFSGVEDVNIYVGDTFNPHDGVKVTDDRDNNFVEHSNECNGHNTNSNSKTTSDEETGCDKHGNDTFCYQVSGSYDNNKVGKYPFTYTSTDSWGRKTTVIRNVYVRPSIFKNRIMLYAKEDTTNEGESDTPESRETTNQSDIKPAFEIGVDNDTGKYTVTNQLDKRLNPALEDGVAFRILIYGKDGTEKAKVELNGNDTGTSSKLEELKKVDYSGEDYIRLWSAEPKYLRITGPINQESDSTENGSSNEVLPLTSENGTDNSENGDNSGNVEGGINGKEDYDNGIDSEDKMKNVAFKLTNDEMSTIYNQAPQFNGLKSTIDILFGDELDLLKDVTISDDKDTNLTIRDVTTKGTVNQNEVGTYKVTHTVTDSWGRSTSQEVTYKVVSKIKENIIEVYGNSSNSAKSTNNSESIANDKKFTLTFNTDTNKIDVNINNNSNAKTTSSNTPEDGTIGENSTQEEPKKDFEIVVRNRDTDIKAKVSLNESEMTSEASFDKLKAITLSNGDTISLYNKNKSNIKIKGHIENSNGKNFETEFPESLEFKNVRFKVTNKGLELFEHESLDGITMNDLSITRGDDSNKYEGIDFKFKSQDSYLGLKIDIKNFDKLKLGKQTATYVFSDSWGSTKELDRKITVTERNKLEENRIRLLNRRNGKKEILRFEFDTIQNKIIPKVAENQPNNYTEAVNNLLNIKLYDSEGVTKSNINVTPSNLNSISEIEYEYDDLISISAYDNQNGLSITGKIEGNREDYNDGVNEKDNIENVRFEIKESGLKSVYNNAPSITISKDLTLFKDESPDLYEDISVEDNDEHDKGKIVDNTQIETNLDITKMGTYKAEYTAVDNWGRKSEPVERTITVKSSLENNKIQYYPPSSDESAIDVTIDNKNNELKVTKNYSTFRKIKKRNTSQGSENTEETTPETIFEVILFDENGESKKALTILSNDDISSVNSKINTFNNTPYEYGDYISVFAKDNEDGVKIIGNIDKELKINEDYSDGIEDIDFMNNVRFRIDEDALEAVYNEAPKMTIPDGVVEVYKGDNHDFTDGVKVSDDHDANLRNSNIIISDEDKDKFNTLGTHKITLTLRDSWGRQVQGERTFNVNTSIYRNEINFGGNRNNQHTRVEIKLGFEPTDNNKIKFKIIQVPESLVQWYDIFVYDSKGNEKKVVNLKNYHRDQEIKNELNKLLEITLDYGDYIKLNTSQKFRYSIDGPVRDGLEDYYDGVQFGDDFENTKFYITDAGLHAHYESPIVLNENESLIEYIGSSGRIPLKMKLNHETNTVTFHKADGYFNYDDSGKMAFKLRWYKSETETTEEFVINGGVMHDFSEVTQLKDAFSQGFNDNDYITLDSYNSKKIRINGKLINGEGVTEEDIKDFNDGIDREYLMTQTRFYLNKGEKKGIIVERLGAPTIEGANDIEIPQGTEFDAREGVKVRDFDGDYITSQMQVTGGDINTGRIGVNEVVYKVTNGNNVTDTVTRNVSVYSTADISLRDENASLYIEQGTSEEDAINYLKPLVQAQDTADNNVDLSEKVEVNINNVNLEVPGTYKVIYSVKNNFDKISTLEKDVTVGRSINVSVPTTLPFQVVTNLSNKEADPFISGVLKIENNNTSEVDVSVESFSKQNDSGNLEIVDPSSVPNWDELDTEGSMSKMALGLYVKSGINGKTPFTKESPLWLESNNTNNIRIGNLPRAINKTTPYEAKLSFTSKHGKKFIGGTSKGKFKLVFKFE